MRLEPGEQQGVSMRQHSDPLPYVQVDRAVRPKAALLADAIGVSRQHAIGSLIEWWELCGDPRDIERVLLDSSDPRVVISAETASTRFRLASGKDVEPRILVECGLLEPVSNGFRVRGMSRYFKPITERLAKRRAASAGGKASVEARKAKYGTSMPFVGSFGGSSNTSSTRDEADANQPRSTVRTTVRSRHEADTKQTRSSDEPATNTADSVQRTASSKEGPPASPPASQPELQLEPDAPKKPKRERRPPDPDAEFERFKASLTPDEVSIFGTYSKEIGVPIGPDWALGKFVREKLKTHTASELCLAIRGYLSDPWKRENAPSLRAIFSDASKIAAAQKRAFDLGLRVAS